MKILHVIPSLDKESGGPAKAVIEFARCQCREHEVVIITTTEGGETPHSERDLHDFRNVEIRRFTYQGHHSSKRSAPLMKWFWEHATRFDIVHIHACFSIISMQTAYFCRKRKIPFVYRPLGTLSPYSLFQGRTFYKKLLLRFVEKPNLAKANAVHCTSQKEAEHVKALVPKARTVVCAIPVSQAEGAGANFSKKRTHRIGFLSRLHPKKNIPFLIDAFAAIPLASELYIAGSGSADYESYVRHYAQTSPRAKNIHFTGFLDGTEKTNFFHNIDLFVLPSQHENFGIVVAEALQHGVPCLISDQVEFPVESFPKDVISIHKLEINEFRDVAQRCLEQQNDRKSIAELALEAFSCKKVLSLLNTMAEKKA